MWGDFLLFVFILHEKRLLSSVCVDNPVYLSAIIGRDMLASRLSQWPAEKQGGMK